MWHFRTSGICFKFDISHHTVIVLLVLGATIVVLLIAQVPLLQVPWPGSKLVLRCCSGHLVPTVFAQELQLWDSYQLPWCEMVVILWQSSKIALPSCALYFADLGQYLYSKGLCTRLSTLEQLPAAMVLGRSLMAVSALYPLQVAAHWGLFLGGEQTCWLMSQEACKRSVEVAE